MTEVAECRIEIEAARALVLRAAAEIDVVIRAFSSYLASLNLAG